MPTLGQAAPLGTAAGRNVGTAAGQVPVLDANGRIDSLVFAAPLVSGRQSGRWYSPTTRSPDLSGVTPAVGTMHAIPIALPACALQAIAVRITTGVFGSLVRLGLYVDNGSGYPGSLLVDAGLVSGATGSSTQAATIAQAFTGGTLWMVAVNQTGTPQLQSLTNNSQTAYALGHPSHTAAIANAQTANGFTMTGVTAALPATFSTTVTPLETIARLAVQIA